ncbi:hypothetical protein D7X96_17330 [Corallococcus interemptor]|uniref:DUF4279 domain-containing protein n=1 Tax=Corallococcus interemptor TaxID=2316720 RepID=A0A3A8QZ80_9BACT|nr:hypothetical protein [Corallococcus interemptor]RKH68444.1 hypothetical protein D7X96_17330 [Corallococcus interemptor]
MTHFLNIDLELRGTTGVRELVQALEPSMLVLRVTDTEASLEHREQPQSVEEGLHWLVQVVENLPAEARRHWDACEARTMDVGIQADSQPLATLFPVSRDAMAALLRIGAELLFTVYAPITDRPTRFDGKGA